MSTGSWTESKLELLLPPRSHCTTVPPNDSHGFITAQTPTASSSILIFSSTFCIIFRESFSLPLTLPPQHSAPSPQELLAFWQPLLTPFPPENWERRLCSYLGHPKLQPILFAAQRSGRLRASISSSDAALLGAACQWCSPGGDPGILGAQGREESGGLPTLPHCTARPSSAAEQEEREQRDEERERCCSAGTKGERRSLCNFITLIKSSPLPYVTALQQSSALHGFF